MIFLFLNTLKNDLFNLKLPELREDELPNISLVTLVNNCRDIFSLTKRNYEDSFYPKDKIEWIVFEETEDDDKCIKDLLTDIRNLKYIRYDNKGDYNYSRSLDMAIKHCSEDIILNMDTMGFYSRENMLSRVKLLIKYPRLLGVGTDKLGYYDIIHKKSFTNRKKDDLFLSSLGIRKKNMCFENNLIFQKKR